jgi:hypothetical protein
LGRITDRTRPAGAARIAASLAATLLLGGCGAVEFQGKIFDYMGVSGERREADVRMSERPPLLLPPDLKTLPPPGNGVAVATAREDWPKNPELVQSQITQAKQDAKAKEVAVQDPLNPLQGKSNPLLEKWLGKKKKAEQPDDTPEPDPSTDKPTEEVAQTRPKPLTPHQPQEVTSEPDPFTPATPDSYKNPSAVY